jgi:hypothetical protein
MALTLALGVIAGVASAQPVRPEQPPQGGAQPAEIRANNTPPFRMRKPEVDFGVVRPHVRSSTVVELFNASKFPITLTRVTATCSCMGGIVDGKQVIPPGEVGEVEITVKGRANPGPIRERVTVWYINPEDGRELNFGLPVTGEVAYAVKAEPFFINLLVEPKRGSIDLTSTDGTRFRVLSFNGEAPDFDEAKLPEGDDGAEATTRTAITYDFSDVPEDDLPYFVTLETDHPESPLLVMRVIHRGLITQANDPTKRPWSLSQDAFNLGLMAAGEAVERQITIVGTRLGEAFEASMASDDIGVEIVSVEDEGRGKMITLRFTMNKAAADMVLKNGVTLTDGPSQMTIPVFAKSAPGA